MRVHVSYVDTDDEGRSCCMGAAAMGRCTCWVTSYNGEQQPAVGSEPAQTRAELCADCACRPDSPERTSNPDAKYDWDDLQGLVESGERFYCHQGMREMVAKVHPDGTRIEYGMAYRPPIREDGTPLKLDGTPADICAGWARLRAAVTT